MSTYQIRGSSETVVRIQAAPQRVFRVTSSSRGPRGRDGFGVPADGVSGQILLKASSEVNDIVWVHGVDLRSGSYLATDSVYTDIIGGRDSGFVSFLDNIHLPSYGALYSANRRTLEIGGYGDAVNYFGMESSPTGDAPILSAQGADTNIDLVLAPKGTGTVSINTKRIRDLSDPINAQDAATKAYVDANAGGGGTSSSYASPIAKPMAIDPTLFTKFTSTEGWTNFFATGSYNTDTTDYVSGVSSLRLEISSALSGARWIQGPTSFSNKGIRIRFKAENWSLLTEFSIRMFTDVGLTEGFILNLRNYFATPNNGEWYDVVFPRSAFEQVNVAGDWSTIRTCYVRGNSASNTKVWVDTIELVPDVLSGGVVTVSFDDSFTDNITEGASYMSTKDIRGSAFIMPDQLGTTNYMTEAQIDQLHDLGWGIGGHHITNMRSVSTATAEGYIKDTKDWLAARGYRGSDHFAWPEGSYNEALMDICRKYFSTARTIDGFNQPLGMAIDMKVNSRTISNVTTLAAIKAMIDEATANNEWLILNFHKIVTTPTVDVEYSRANFRSVIDYLVTQGTKTLPYHEVVEKLVGRPVPVVSGGSGQSQIVTVSSGNFTAGAAASTNYIYILAGNHTPTMPTAVGNTNRYTIKNAHTASIAVAFTSSQTADGGGITLKPGASVDLVSNNTEWKII